MTTSRRPTSRRLTAALARTLEVKAEQAVTAEQTRTAARAFDPARRPSTVALVTDLTDPLDDMHDVPGRSPRRAGDGRAPAGRRRLLSAAAVIVVVALVGAGALALLAGSDEEPVDTVVVADPPDGWLVPTSVPEAMELWGVEWSSSSGQPPISEPGAGLQLFGDPDGGRALYVTSFRYEVRSDTAEQVTVRGQAGQAGRAWDVEERDVGDALAWDERGATITALYRGTTRAEAIAVLDSLEWRSGDPADGFAPPSDGSWPLRGEVGSQQPTGRDATLLYSDGVPASDPAAGRLGLRIHTSSSSAVSAGYLEEWYRQGSAAGGGDRPLSSYEQDRHELTVLWADGRSITISPSGVPQAELPGRAALERIADTLTVATEADLAALADTAGANVEALPVLASAGTSIGTVNVHGESGFLRLCLRPPSEQGPRCTTGTLGGGSLPDGTATVTAEWTVEGTWYVVVASTGDEPRIVGGRNRSSSPDAGELPAETAIAGEWTIRVVEPAPDIELVCTSSGVDTSCDHHRPG